MSLLITVIKAPDSASLAESSKTFDQQGGTIGRGQDNSWILDDPERFLSSRHCEFSSENGQFFITDLSTNGTFYNGSPNPIGKGSKLPLNDGDTFLLGDYEFSVKLANSAASAVSQPTADPFASSSSPFDSPDPFASSGDPFTQGGDFSSDPFGGGHVSSSESLFSTNPEETDPLAALDKAQGGSANINSLGNMNSGGFAAVDDPFKSAPASDPFNSAADPFSGPTHSDQADPLNEQVSWPESVAEENSFAAGGIPDDWDDDLLAPASPAQPAAQPFAQAQAAPPAAQTPPVAQQPPVQPSTPLTEPPVVPRPAQAKTAPTDVQFSAPEAPVAKPQPAAQPANLNVGENSQSQASALEMTNARIQAELEILKQKINSQQRSAPGQITVDTTLIDAMGLSSQNLSDAEVTQINKLTGEVVREMVSGLMQVLGSRSSIKNEFRMNVTTIQPVENNPLKFSANVDDALENMFLKQGNAYKKPVDAVHEGFNGVAEHQVAILAGIKAAFKGVIERFDPSILEARFAKQNKGGLIPGSQKAKNWDLFQEYYNELAGDIDNSFQYLFGDDFVQAYEDQLQKLTIARKPTKANKNT